MTYETVRVLSAMSGMIIFMTLFAGALYYALAPGNREKFERAARLPLGDDKGEA